MIENQLIENDVRPLKGRRRALLPIWIKIFLWMFMIFGAIAPVGFIAAIFGFDFNLSLYGLETNKGLSITGLLIIILFTIKGAVSFGLWTEKDWAVKLARIDAMIGIVVCAVVMLVLPFIVEDDTVNFTLRLELVALIPYLLKMEKIMGAWEERSKQ